MPTTGPGGRIRLLVEQPPRTPEAARKVAAEHKAFADKHVELGLMPALGLAADLADAATLVVLVGLPRRFQPGEPLRRQPGTHVIPRGPRSASSATPSTAATGIQMRTNLSQLGQTARDLGT